MYKEQTNPDFQVVMDNGSTLKPLVTLKDEYGGISHIVKDGSCYVLVNGGIDGSVFCKTYHWYPEAVTALRALPDLEQP